MIRDENPTDVLDIRRITERAFSNMPYASGDEQDVIDRLRTSKALSISLVAIKSNKLLGHIAFSPAMLESKDDGWFALGPVSVCPEHQGHGIGSELIRAGLKRLELAGANGCILTGNPSYYDRFGFELAPEHCPNGEPAEYFMMQQFNSELVVGQFTFHKAFYCAG